MPQLYRAETRGRNKLASPAQVTKLNEDLVNGREYAKTEIIRWKGSNDEMVEGILYYPTNYEEGKKYPLITAIHGGPQGSDKDLWGESWAYPIQLLTQRGSFVLRPNYHGSNNYGLKWSESICCGKYYDLETPDINAGVDYMIAKGLRRCRQNRDDGLVERIDSLDEPDHHVSRALQGRERRRRRHRMDQRLGQRRVWRSIRRVLFRQVADAGSAAVHQ